ncbi:hypothetical protein Cgig2_008547 [Carnegiea gigantea]|uniref:Uncharacterized protein n=1 Tax=Carnegiea gigantea TaxID=171969 RepID=A0A9Q1JXE4_9CARY|nr:hypothetical protein Cgig2_008547 [Carnegiea gigantea]
MLTIGEERTNTDIFTPDVGAQVDPASPSSPVQSSDVIEIITVGESVPSGQSGEHSMEAELVIVGEGQSPYGEERPKSSIAKRVRTHPQPRNPSVMQSFPYLHPDRAVGKDKHKCSNVYTSRKRSKKHGGVSAATDSDVGGAAPGKEPIVQPVADEGFPTGQLRVDDVDGSVHVQMVTEEGAAKDAEGTAVRGEVKVDYVHNSIDQGGDGGCKSPCDVVIDAGVVVTDEKRGLDGPEVRTQSEKGATYDGPMVTGVDAVRFGTHGTEAETSAGPSTQTFAVVEGTIDEGRDGSGNPSPVTVVVTMSDEDSLPTSSEAGRGRQSPQQHPQCAVCGKCKGALEVGQAMVYDIRHFDYYKQPFEEQGISMAIVPWRCTLEAYLVL